MPLHESVRDAEPRIVIAWHPELLTPDQYAAIIVAIGDVVRSEGAVGITRIKAKGLHVLEDVEAPV